MRAQRHQPVECPAARSEACPRGRRTNSVAVPKGEGRQYCKRAAIQYEKAGGADVKRGEGGRIRVKGLVVVLSELPGDCVGLGDHVLP
jgi:hypothetical protein